MRTLFYIKDKFGSLILTVFFLLVISGCKETNDAPATSIDFCSAHPEFCGKKYNEASFLMTHNAFNYAGMYLLPNQSFSIARQLTEGVRGLMIDVYDGPEGALVYHGVSFTGQQPLEDVLLPIKNFLDNNPNEIISIIFENNCTNAALEAGLIATGLDQYAYVHDGEWKLMEDMVEANTRLVMFVESNRGGEPRQPWLHYAWGTVFDTPYSFQNIEDFDCSVNRGGSGSKELFLVNHWLGSALSLPDKTLSKKANKRSVLSPRLQECSAANSHFVNFVGVDFYDVGDDMAVVDSINGL